MEIQMTTDLMTEIGYWTEIVKETEMTRGLWKVIDCLKVILTETENLKQKETDYSID
jgi:hypothetical protein